MEHIMTNPVDQAIAAAKAQASQTVDVQPTNAVVVAQQSSTAVATTYKPAAPSLESVAAGTQNVDGYLKVKEVGLRINDKPNIVESIKVAINMDPDMGEVVAFEGVRFSNPPQYLKTYDGVTAVTGGTWNEALERARLVDKNVKPYAGVDFAMELIEDVKDMKGVLVAEAGTRLGHSTSITNRANWSTFYKEVKAANLLGEVVEAEITSETRTNSNGQTWGVLKFKLLGAHAQE